MNFHFYLLLNLKKLFIISHDWKVNDKIWINISLYPRKKTIQINVKRVFSIDYIINLSK